METYLDHYILGGGWAMLLLVPASLILSVAAIRAALAFRRSRIEGDEEGTSTSFVQARLREMYQLHGTLTAEDIRAAVDGEALRLFALLQPLSGIAVLAPLAGMLGTVTSVMSAHTDAARRGTTQFLAASVERALIPSFWGLAIALAASAIYLILRARLFQLERQVLEPAAGVAAEILLGKRKPGKLLPERPIRPGEEHRPERRKAFLRDRDDESRRERGEDSPRPADAGPAAEGES